jgi:hypothetical protein
MNRTALVSRALIATAALTAVGLMAASPASAHTNNMYTVVTESDDAGGGLSTYGKADGVVAPLPEADFLNIDEIGGIEVAGEKGVGVGYYDGWLVFSWDHSTGVVLPLPKALAINNPLQELDYVTGLDTLSDGTTVTLASYEQSNGVEVPTFTTHIAIASVNVGTGEVIPLLDLTAALSIQGSIAYDVGSLATDPISGATYVFIVGGQGQPYFIETEVAGGTVGPPIRFEGADFGNGQIEGADFDADGTLYFNYFDFTDDVLPLELSKLPAGSQWITADRAFISKAPSNFGTYAVADWALTIEYTAPALAATGSELPILATVLVGSVATLAGGLTVMVARRRSERGTV